MGLPDILIPIARLALLVPFALFAQLAHPFSDETPSGPAIAISPERLDLGAHHAVGAIERSVRISNVGDEPLIVESVQSTCSCTRAELSASTILPGQDVDLIVVADLRMAPGERLSSTVLLRSNDPVHPEWPIPIEATILPEFTVEPPIVDFERIKAGTRPSRVVRVAPTPGFTVTLGALESSQGLVAERHPANLMQFTVALDTTQPPGRYRGKILIHTDVQRLPIHEIPVEADIVGIEYDLAPQVLILRAVDGSRPSGRVEIRATQDAVPLTVDIEEIHVPGIDVRILTLEAGRRYALDAELSASAAPGRIRGHVILVLREGGLAERRQLNVIGNV